MDAIKKVYLTDDEDILSTCAVGVTRPTLRVYLPLGMTYCDFTEVERSTVWAFERLLQRDEPADKTGVWLFRGIGTELSSADIRDLNPVGLRVLEADSGYDNYDELVDSGAASSTAGPNSFTSPTLQPPCRPQHDASP